MTSIGEQLELSWFDAWMHEKRDVHGRWAGAVVAQAGDPSTAKNIVVYVPGTGSYKNFEPGQGELQRAGVMQRAIEAQGSGKSAVEVWGYNAPLTIPGGMLHGPADHAAAALAQHVNAVRKAHPGAHVTVISHSYGSYLSGIAAREHGMRPDDLVALGSPGMGTRHVTDLGLPPGHVWVGAERRDPVARVSGALRPDLGGDPDQPAFGAQQFRADDPRATFSGVTQEAAHHSYWYPTSQALPNIAAIAAGNYRKVTRTSEVPHLLTNDDSISDQLELADDKGWRNAWRHELRGAHGEWVHTPNTKAARAEIGKALDEQGLGRHSPLRGVLGDARGNRLLVHRDPATGKIDAGMRYSFQKRRVTQTHSIEINDVRVLPERKGIGTRMLQEVTKAHPDAKDMAVYGAVDQAVPFYEKTGAKFPTYQGKRFSSMGEWSPEAVQSLRQSAEMVNSVGDQLELSWRDAWMHERRNAHGEWTRDGAGVGEQLLGFHRRPTPKGPTGPGTPDENITRQIITWDNAARYEFHNHDEANALSQATDSYQNGDFPDAAMRLRQAAGVEGVDEDRARAYTDLADGLDPANALGPLHEVGLQFTRKAAGIVPGLISHHGTLGKTSEQWDGKVVIFPAGSRPSVFGELGWDGTIELQDEAVKTMREAQESPQDPIGDSAAFTIPLHELIHGTVIQGEDTSGDERAYQNPNVAAIEEGFTELGTIHHASEFFGQMGVGHRKALDFGSEAEQRADLQGSDEPFTMDTTATYTMDEYARKVDTPQNINDGNAWGHYGWQTRVANEWCQEIADEEGLKGQAAEDRARVLSDEINLHGAGHKVEYLARQSYRAQGVNYDDLRPRDRRSLEASISKAWNASAKNNTNAAAAVRGQVQQLKERMMQERSERGLRR